MAANLASNISWRRISAVAMFFCIYSSSGGGGAWRRTGGWRGWPSAVAALSNGGSAVKCR